MPTRLTGIASGLDTASIIESLMQGHKTKVDTAKNDQKKLQWKKEAWSSLNTKLYSFYTGALSKFKSVGTYKAKKVSSTNDKAVTMSASNNAVTGTHTLSVKQVASSQYVTGRSLKGEKYPLDSDEATAVTGSTKLSDMGIDIEDTKFFIKVGDGDTKTIEINQDTTLSDLAGQFSKNGIVASYDEKQGRFFLNSTESGKDYAFKLTSSNSSALEKLGLNATEYDEYGNVTKTGATEVEAKDAIVLYNGATFQQSSNNFSLNGLNFTVNDVTIETDKDGKEIEGSDNPIRLTVTTDTDTIYNAVKDFVKEYNALIKEMNTLYNAESAKDYEMLTDEKKEAMSETEVKDWEDKIKASLLRRDTTISSLLSTMRTTLNKGVEYTGSDGASKRYSLATFGIVTGEYSELGQLHIEGDADDSAYSGKNDKLRAAIESNPDALIATLSGLGNDLFSSFQKAMKSSELSSALTFYNDKQMDSEITSYDDKIKILTTKMNNAEDRYYKQFAAMESAMAAMQAQQSSLSGLFGSL